MYQYTFPLFVAAFLNIQVALTWTELELVRFDNIDCSLWKSYLKFKRVDKTTYGISGRVEFLNDFSNDWQLELIIYHSAIGNNQFVKLPYGAPKDELCDSMDGFYKSIGLAKDIADTLQIPEPKPNERVCKNYKKGNYTVRQYILSPKVIPKYLPEGLHKYVYAFTNEHSGENSSFAAYVRLY